MSVLNNCRRTGPLSVAVLGLCVVACGGKPNEAAAPEDADSDAANNTSGGNGGSTQATAGNNTANSNGSGAGGSASDGGNNANSGGTGGNSGTMVGNGGMGGNNNNTVASNTTGAPAELPEGPYGTLPEVNCTGLTPGQWQAITPPQHSAGFESADFVVDENTGLVYLGTNSENSTSQGVLRTADCGATWEHVSTGLNAEQINNGRQWTFRINTEDGRIMYTNSGYYELGLWKSYNGGIDWYEVTPTNGGGPGFVGNLQMDPEDTEHLLMTWHDSCRGVNGGESVGCFHESHDGGRTWTPHYGNPAWPSQVRVLSLGGSKWVILAETLLYTADGGANYESIYNESLGNHSAGTLSYGRNGDFYIGFINGILRSPAASAGREWALAAPGTWVGEVADAEQALFATQQNNNLMRTSGDDPGAWALDESSPEACERIKYDPVHKIVYASCSENGFHRLVLE